MTPLAVSVEAERALFLLQYRKINLIITAKLKFRQESCLANQQGNCFMFAPGQIVNRTRTPLFSLQPLFKCGAPLLKLALSQVVETMRPGLVLGDLAAGPDKHCKLTYSGGSTS